MSNVAVNWLTDKLTVIIRGVLTNIVVKTLVDVTINVFPDVFIAFKFAMPGPLE